MSVSPLIKLKTAVGTTWAGRVLHAQTYTNPLVNGAITLPRTTITNSVKTRQSIAYAIVPTSHNLVLVCYHDNSALLVDLQDMGTLTPAILYFPEKVTVNGQSFHLSLQDIINPKNSPRFTPEQVALVEAAFTTQLAALAAKVSKLSFGETPWLLAADTRTREDARTLGLILKGLKELGMEGLSLKGRLLKPTGKPGPLRVEETRFRSAAGVKEYPALRAMMDHPAFPVPAERQVRQGWDQILSSSDALSFTNLDLDTITPLASAHEKTHALHLATQVLRDTQTDITSLTERY